MTEEVKFVMDSTKDAMDKSIAHLEAELKKIRAGKAHPSMLDSVMVDYYGAPTPIGQVANVSTMDARTITVQPWEKSTLDAIATGIINSNLGLNPQNNGESILISVPPLTEERRKELVKRAKAEGEHAKVGIRNARKDANDELKSLKNDGLSEDMHKDAENQVQKLTDSYVTIIEEHLAIKEKDIMTV